MDDPTPPNSALARWHSPCRSYPSGSSHGRSVVSFLPPRRRRRTRACRPAGGPRPAHDRRAPPALVPPAVAMAPLLPRVLGPEWVGMVVPLQVLVVVGVGHALLNVIGGVPRRERQRRLSHPRQRRLGRGMVTALVLLVGGVGVRGAAAAAHALLFVPLMVAYVVRGTRRLGLDPHGWSCRSARACPLRRPGDHHHGSHRGVGRSRGPAPRRGRRGGGRRPRADDRPAVAGATESPQGGRCHCCRSA
jgi:hypothetical protein